MAKKAKSSLGITFWVALLVFLVLIYAANKVNFSSLMGDAGVARLFGGDYRSAPAEGGEKPEDTAPEAPPARETTSPAVTIVQTPAPETTAPPEKPAGRKPETPTAPAVPAPPAPKTEARPKTPAPAAKPAAPKTPAAPAAAVQPAKKPEPAETAKIREAVLYFIRLSDSGEVTLTKTPREIRSAGAPLTDTLRALTAGPTETESRTGCTSLIPAGSRLLSVTVTEGVAYVNFDDSFRFNSFGREGYTGQLRQIVYTATEFPTIQAVQILINGGKIDYLGSEGVYIGKPVGRNSI